MNHIAAIGGRESGEGRTVNDENEEERRRKGARDARGKNLNRERREECTFVI